LLHVRVALSSPAPWPSLGTGGTGTARPERCRAGQGVHIRTLARPSAVPPPSNGPGCAILVEVNGVPLLNWNEKILPRATGSHTRRTLPGGSSPPRRKPVP